MNEDKKIIVEQWFKKAENDLINITNNMKFAGYPADTVCFHAQQAIEKCLKGLLVCFGEPVSKTHDLVFLANTAKKYMPKIEKLLTELDEVSRFGVDVRYPDSFYEPSSEDAEHSLKLAVEIKRMCAKKVEECNT